jgi:hypothetical protein
LVGHHGLRAAHLLGVVLSVRSKQIRKSRKSASELSLDHTANREAVSVSAGIQRGLARRILCRGISVVGKKDASDLNVPVLTRIVQRSVSVVSSRIHIGFQAQKQLDSLRVAMKGRFVKSSPSGMIARIHCNLRNRDKALYSFVISLSCRAMQRGVPSAILFPSAAGGQVSGRDALFRLFDG